MLRKIIETSTSDVISGEDAFKLYDTYGFPFELTEEILKEANKSVDKAGFDLEMQNQKERARASRGDLQSMGTQMIDLMNF